MKKFDMYADSNISDPKEDDKNANNDNSMDNANI